MARYRSFGAAEGANLAGGGEPIRPTVVWIDRAALVHNFRQIETLAGEAGILAVVKADAYGHGAVACAQVLEREGVAFFGVGLIEEGLELRDAGIEAPILVVDGAYGDRYDLLVGARLTPFVFRAEQLEGLAAAARSQGCEPVAHLKIDTGMGRVGIQASELGAFLDAAAARGVRLEGVATHLGNADVEGHPQIDVQLRALGEAAEAMGARGSAPRWIHLANSAALVSRSDLRGSLVRPGMLLYGCHPSEASRAKIDLRPILRWTTAITHLKEVPPGTTISYGSRWVAERPSKIATLPVGYADGLNRLLSNRGELLIRGERVRIAGTVTMDQIMVDVTDVRGVSVGDEAVIIGAQGEDSIDVEEHARICGTISYEIFCNIGPRVPRLYHG